MARRSSSLRSAAAASGTALPGDVRLMNAVAAAVFALVGIGLAAAAVLWLARAHVFDIRSIRVDGELTRNSVPTIRANALPSLAGNFFTVDLGRAQRAFEQVPWVRHAVVRRVFPDQLAVRLEEHHAAALWEDAAGAEGAERLVDSYGDVFEANIGDVEDDGLPLFAGPPGSAAQMLVMWHRLQPAFARGGLALDRLQLSGRGSWRVETDDDAVVELGRGSDDEVMARSERFLASLAQVRARFAAPLAYADLRHGDGYALRLRGVGTAAVKANGTNGAQGAGTGN